MYIMVMARPDGRPGAALRPAAVDCAAIFNDRASGKLAKDAGPPCKVEIYAGSFVRDGIPLSLLADTLSTRLGRHVADKTGLTGLFDVELRFRAPTAAADSNEPDLITALQDRAPDAELRFRFTSSGRSDAVRRKAPRDVALTFTGSSRRS